MISSTYTHKPTEADVATHLTIQYKLTLAEIKNVTVSPLVKKILKKTTGS